MAIYIDSAYLADIQAITHLAPLSGATTNPTLLLAAQERGQTLRTQEVLEQLLKLLPGQIFMQPSVLGKESGYREALAYIQVDPERVTPKIPMTEIGVQIAQRLQAEGHRIAFTAVTTVAQAYIASLIGAHFIIPYYNRLRRSGIDPYERISQMALMLARQQSSTRIMAASIKSAAEATSASLAGAHDLTIAPQILIDMITDPETEEAVEKFENDRKKIK
jgi:Transaldolase